MKLKSTIKLLILTLMIVIGAFSVDALAQSKPAQQNKSEGKTLDSIAAVVNGDIITQRQFDAALANARQQFSHSGIPIPSEKLFRKKILDGLIYQKLQLQLAKRAGISVSEKELDATISKIAQHNHVTMAQLKEQIAMQGLKYDTFRDQIRKQLTIRKLQSQVVSGNVAISSADIDNFRKQHAKQLTTSKVHLLDFLIALPDSPTKSQISHATRHAKKLARQLRNYPVEKVLAMKANKSVAKADLGFRTINDLPSIFSKPAAKLTRGDVSQPIVAPNGVHVLKLLDKKDSTKQLSDMQIKQIIYRQKQQDKLKNWLKKLKKNAYIQINVKF